MSAGTLEQPHLGGDDGSGDARDWEEWQTEVEAEVEDEPVLQGGRAYEMYDVGKSGYLPPRRAARLGRMASGTFAENFATDRVMPRLQDRRIGGRAVQTMIGSEYYLG